MSKVSSFISSFARISIFYLNITFLNNIFPKTSNRQDCNRRENKLEKKWFMISNLCKRDKNMLMFHFTYSPRLSGCFSTKNFCIHKTSTSRI
jgi:hypothetical protein